MLNLDLERLTLLFHKRFVHKKPSRILIQYFRFSSVRSFVFVYSYAPVKNSGSLFISHTNGFYLFYMLSKYLLSLNIVLYKSDIYFNRFICQALL